MTETLGGLDVAQVQQALEVARQERNVRTAATLSLALATHHRAEDDDRQAAWDLYEEAEGLCVSLGDTDGALEAAIQLSQMALEGKDDRATVRWIERALTHGDDSLSATHRARLLHNLAVAHAQLGEQERALELYREAMRHWRPNADTVGRRSSLIAQGALLLERGQHDDAATALLGSLAVNKPGTGQLEPALACTRLELLASAFIGSQRFIEAVEPLQKARDLWEQLDRPAEHRRATLRLAQALFAISPQDPDWVYSEDPLTMGLATCQHFAELSRADGDVEAFIYGQWLAARALEQHGKFAEAIGAWAQLGKAVAQTGADGDAHTRRAAWLQLQILPEDPDVAQAGLIRAERLYRQVGDEEAAHWCRHRRVHVFSQAQRWQEAADALRDITPHEPEDPDHRLTLLAHRLHFSALAQAHDDAARVAQEALTLLGGRPHPLRDTLNAFVQAGPNPAKR